MLFSGPIVISHITYLSDTICKKALALSEEACRLEVYGNCRLPIQERPLDEHRGTVIASLIMFVTFLECYFNEFIKHYIIDIKDNRFGIPNRDKIEAIFINKKTRPTRISTAEKFNWLLTTARTPCFDKQKVPFTDVELLTKLRNYIVHYHADPVDLARIDLNKFRQLPLNVPFERDLKHKFRNNLLMSDTSNPFFPGKCLGAGCTEWAARITKDFVQRFHDKLGFDPNKWKESL